MAGPSPTSWWKFQIGWPQDWSGIVLLLIVMALLLTVILLDRVIKFYQSLFGPDPRATYYDDYTILLDTNQKEALGFIKDWATSILQLETAVIGAFGAALVLKDTPEFTLTAMQAAGLLPALTMLVISMFCGTMLLNMLPGAVQRKGRTDYAINSDIYTIYTEGQTNIYRWSNRFRLTFLIGMAFIAFFVAARTLRL